MRRTKLVICAMAVFVACMVVFIWLMMFMERKSQESIRDIGSIYMAEMNKQLQQKFFTLVRSRWAELEGLVERTPPSSVTYGPHMISELRLNAEVRNFLYLGLVSQKDGTQETLYGAPITIANMPDFWKLLDEDDQSISYGSTPEGSRLLVLGVRAAYPMKDGEKSTAIVAGLDVQELIDVLFANDTNSMLFTHIVDKDGRFVFRSRPNDSLDYFQLVRDTFSVLGRKTSLHYIEEMKSAMNDRNDYSALVRISDQFHHLYLSALPNTDWFFVSELPQGVLEEPITRLSDSRMYATLSVAGVVLLLLLLMFGYYYLLSQAQMRRLYVARQEAERANQAKSVFLSNMSHDIRTPMNAVVGMTDIAMSNLKNTARVEDCLKKIKLSSKHLLGLINDILDMSKIESGKLTLMLGRVSLRETIADLINIIQPQIKANNQHFDVFVHNVECETIQCDSVRLNQILLNLLSNAVKFTPADGEIDVFLSQEPSPRGEEYVRTHLRVKDTGIGMSPEFKEKIFESFSREDNERVYQIMGTGLGMAITKYLVDMMGGEITVESTQGVGTEFHVVLDFKRVTEAAEEMKLPDWHVLVVDDNKDLLESAASMLADLGVHADVANSGEAAIRMVEEHRAKGKAYDLVLLDWKMPDMDGLETARKICGTVAPDVQFYLISAYDWAEIEDQAREDGFRGFISKPLFKSALYYGLLQSTCAVQDEDMKTDPFLSTAADLTGRRILLAEDNELNWEVAHDILHEAGLEVEWAENGRICVEKFEASEPGYYDAILMDLRMPEMTGYEATEAIRASSRPDKNIPIIAMTADAFAEDIHRCLACGMNAHTTKPINITELFQLLRKHLS